MRKSIMVIVSKWNTHQRFGLGFGNLRTAEEQLP